MRTRRESTNPIPNLEWDKRIASLYKPNGTPEPSEEPLCEVRQALEEALKLIERSLQV